VIRYHARWVLPVTAAPIENGTVAVDDGRIAYVGARGGAPVGDDRELGNAALLPGLVNAHTHLELTAMRGTLEDLEFHDWIARLRASRNEVLTPEMLLDSARWGVIEGLRAGTTTFADTCSSGVALRAMTEAGVRGIMYHEVFGPDPLRCDSMIADLRARVSELRPLENRLVRLGISPHAPYTVSDALYVEAARLAAAEELPLAVHIGESDAETQLVVEACGAFADALRARGITVESRARSPIALLEKAGVLGARTLLIHCVRLDSQDISVAAAANCGVAHCPVSNAKLGHGVAPLMEMLAAGMHVGLGSDSVASNNRMDILEEARAAVLLQRVRSGQSDTLAAHAALELATIGGARALGMADRVGSLEVGKEADLAAFSLAGVTPVGDPEAAVVFSLYRRDASFVAVGGRVLVGDGAVLGDHQGLAERVQRAGDALARWHWPPVQLYIERVGEQNPEVAAWS
jgi:cytosine/adenosine deaminase-related metal-dependent hydrolase